MLGKHFGKLGWDILEEMRMGDVILWMIARIRVLMREKMMKSMMIMTILRCQDYILYTIVRPRRGSSMPGDKPTLEGLASLDALPRRLVKTGQCRAPE